MHVPMVHGSTVEDERKSQHRERDGFHKSNDEEKGIVFVPGVVSDKQNSSVPAEKLCFGIFSSARGENVGSELQAVQRNSSTGPPNFMATAEFAKRISVSNLREEASAETDRSGRKSESSERDTERIDKYCAQVVTERRKYIHDQEKDRQSTSKAEDKKTSDAKQLLATVPKMKEELFAYDVNWEIYDKHGLHERMRPWISKKATAIFGQELADFVDYAVRSTKEYVEAPRMLELLASILNDCAEMFVISMWRQLIFEIRKVEQD